MLLEKRGLEVKLVKKWEKEKIKCLTVNGENYPLEKLVIVKLYENPTTWIVEGKKEYVITDKVEIKLKREV